MVKVEEDFTLYTFRHTCLTRGLRRWIRTPLAHLAGRSDFSTAKRYVHPQTETVLAAFERARKCENRA